MRSRDFAFWLQGFFELTDTDGKGLHPDQVRMIRRHLALVFQHEIDPSMGDEKKQAALNVTHHGPIGGEGPGGVLYRG